MCRLRSARGGRIRSLVGRGGGRLLRLGGVSFARLGWRKNLRIGSLEAWRRWLWGGRVCRV